MTDSKDTTMGTVSIIFGVLGCLGIGACWGSLIAVITGRMSRGTAGESNGKIGGILGWIMIIVPVIVVIIYVILALTVLGGFFWAQLP